MTEVWNHQSNTIQLWRKVDNRQNEEHGHLSWYQVVFNIRVEFNIALWCTCGSSTTSWRTREYSLKPIITETTRSSHTGSLFPPSELKSFHWEQLLWSEHTTPMKPGHCTMSNRPLPNYDLRTDLWMQPSRVHHSCNPIGSSPHSLSVKKQFNWVTSKLGYSHLYPLTNHD